MHETFLGRGGDGTVSLLPCPAWAVAVKRVISIYCNCRFLFLIIIFIAVVVVVVVAVVVVVLVRHWVSVLWRKMNGVTFGTQ